MSLGSNFTRFFTLAKLLRRYCDKIVRRRKWYQNYSHPLIKRYRDNDFDIKRTSRNLSSNALFRGPRIKIPREPQSGTPIDKIDEDEQEEGFLECTQRAILILAKIVVVSSVITTLVAAYLITRVTHTNVFPIILQRGIEFLGPIFIKFGQWISTRRDVFPRDICDALSRLQRNTTPHSWMYTKRLLEATYGPSWRDLFVKFDNERLIGSGCCAQVYKASIDLNTMNVTDARKSRISRFVENKTLNGSNKFASASPCARKLQAVAVKVLHPGIKSQLKYLF